MITWSNWGSGGWQHHVLPFFVLIILWAAIWHGFIIVQFLEFVLNNFWNTFLFHIQLKNQFKHIPKINQKNLKSGFIIAASPYQTARGLGVSFFLTKKQSPEPGGYHPALSGRSGHGLTPRQHQSGRSRFAFLPQVSLSYRWWDVRSTERRSGVLKMVGLSPMNQIRTSGLRLWLR